MATQRTRRRLTIALVVLMLLIVIAALLALWGNRDTPPTRAPQQVNPSAEQLTVGRYLVHAGDCAACHQTDDSLPFAGGMPIETPFGTIYGTNITPHPDHGIGRWTADEFHRALTRGQAPGGRNLYPAMPYVSYHAMTREDSDLIYAYLMQQRPSAERNRPPQVPFPFNLRILLAGWNLLFFDANEALPVASAGASAAWQRGRYLTNVLGHCGECHTPRGMLGQLQRDDWLGGFAMNRYLAPALTPTAMAGRGWRPADVVDFLRDGESERGSAFDEMNLVVRHSSQHLSDDDLQAVATFLLGDQPPAAQSSPVPAAAVADDAGRRHYQAWCAGCHGSEGQGLPHTVPPMAGNSTLRSADARNLVRVMLDGIPAQRLDRDTAMAGMPSYAELSDAELAAIANFARSRWGGQPGDVTEAMVRGSRRNE